MASPSYHVIQDYQTEIGIKYYFTSKGNLNIIKAVEYSYSMDFNDKKVYNLAFGDYDVAELEINDAVNTQNGDVYKVFNTVLSTIPMFFESFLGSMMIVKGSDSSADFIEKCKLTCNRKCIDNCKKSHRRINVYQGFVNKNFDDLKNTFNFYGGIESDIQITIEDYIINKRYDVVLVTKK